MALLNINGRCVVYRLLGSKASLLMLLAHPDGTCRC
ncbi:hypothetical protein Q427_24055 [Halomonas sp. BC04]|nr:hypothetical protein Q427_24055 [Halomonas sp. BC04]